MCLFSMSSTNFTTYLGSDGLSHRSWCNCAVTTAVKLLWDDLKEDSTDGGSL